MYDDNETYKDYTGSDVTMDSSFNINIDTSKPISIVLYIAGNHENSLVVEYL